MDRVREFLDFVRENNLAQGNFLGLLHILVGRRISKSDGTLMLVCCERDVDVTDFRRVLEEHLKFRFPGK